MTVKIRKTKYMIVNPSNSDKSNSVGLHIDDMSLSHVHMYEHLVVHIDDKLSMGSHIENICSKVQKKYGILKKVHRYITEETALLIYKVMIRPHFDYDSDCMIDSGVQGKINKMERTQDKIV